MVRFPDNRLPPPGPGLQATRATRERATIGGCQKDYVEAALPENFASRDILARIVERRITAWELIGQNMTATWNLAEATLLTADPERRLVEATDFAAIVEQHYPRLLRTAFVMTGQTADAEDLAQDALIQAWQARTNFAHRSRPETWLYSILLNIDRKRRRSLLRSWRRMLTWFQLHGEKESAAPGSALQTAEWRDSLWSTVAELPTTQRHVVILKYAEGLTHEQIATILNCPLGTVKSRLHHGLRNLARKLTDEHHEIPDSLVE